MAIERGHRFPIDFDEAFPDGLVLVGEIGPDNEFQEDKSKPAKQKIDEVTGLFQWKGIVTDPGEKKAKRASFEVIWTAKVQPVPTTEEFVPGCGMRPLRLTGVTAQPKVAGQGEFKFLTYTFRATGIAEPQSASKSSSGAVGSGSAGKAAA